MASDALQHRTYTLDQVRKHSQPDDLWMVILGKVYNVTAFAHNHPGGVEVLLDCGGVDATGAFDDVAHSQDAKDMLEPYWIGVLDTYKPLPTPPGLLLPLPLVRKCKLAAKRRGRLVLTSNLAVVMVLVLIAIVCFGTLLQLQKLQWLKLTAL